MQKKEKFHEGKAKILYTTDDDNVLIQHFKNDVTAFNDPKFTKVMAGKGQLNNEISSIIMKKLDGVIPTHFIKKLNEIEQLVKPVKIVPIEIVVRNVASGSFAKNYGVQNGTPLKSPTFEMFLKRDELNDPLISPSCVVALGIASEETIQKMKDYAFKINAILKSFFEKSGISLVDFKTEFGFLKNGEFVLADEISPDTCRLWDIQTGKILDKDVFRKNLGDVLETYGEILKRIKSI